MEPLVATAAKRVAILANHKSAKWSEVGPILGDLAASKVTNTKSLVSTITTLMELAGHIKYARSERLRALSRYIESLQVEQQVAFFTKVVPFIAHCALKGPTYFPNGEIPLCSSANPRVDILKESIPAVLGQMFFCCIPVQPPETDLAEYIFHGIMCDDAMFHQGGANGKLNCLLAYFDSLSTEGFLKGDLKIVRNQLTESECDISSWLGCGLPLKNVVLKGTGRIEDDSPEALMVDFANEYIGGGIDATCVQEQILFAIHPELFVTCLVGEKMKENEAILVEGARRISTYEGYDEKFRFTGKHTADSAGRKIVAIDAVYLDSPEKRLEQFAAKLTMRELNKAFAGFASSKGEASEVVATGKWGSGAFNGNTQYKFLIQWLAASRAGKDMHFYTFGDPSLDPAKEWREKLVGKKTVGEMTQILLKIGEEMAAKKMAAPFDILNTILTLS